MREVQALSRVNMRRVAGAEYPQWTFAITAVAVVGYGISIVNALVVDGLAVFPGLFSEIAAFVAALAGLAMSRRQPTRAAALTLVAVWGELQAGFLLTSTPFAFGMLATPLLVAGAGLLLGSGWSLGFALSSSLLAPVLVAASPALGGAPLSSVPELERAFVLHAIVSLGTWVVVSAGLRAFGRSFIMLESSEQRLAETVRMAPDGILLVASNERVTAINPAAERILGVQARDWLGHPIGDLLAAAGADEDLRAFFHPGRSDAAPLPVAFTQPGRGTVHVELTTRGMLGGGEQWMLHDISERTRAETTRRAMELQLAHVQRMEAVGQLAGGVAHDFNNLLTAIGASAEMLRMDATTDDERALVDEIVGAQERGRTLTRQLLAFARRDLANPRIFDLGEQVHEMERLLVRVAGERVRFSFQLGADCRVRADVGQLEQALVNLVSNARDAMPDGGACRVSVASIVGSDGTPWVSLTVSDTGLGMDEATRRHAFEPFYTTKPRGKGTGLGLASVHGIVAASGGRARIDSVPGLGTTVTLEFPAMDGPIDVHASADSPVPVVRTEGTVLVAEDDDAIRQAVRRILTRVGYTVTLATDGQEAARIAETRGTPFDLVLTDVIMPSLTGPQLVARLRRRWPNQAAIFMSGYPEDALAEVPNFSIHRDFMAKPFKAADLEQRVAEAIAASKKGADAPTA